MRTFNTFEEARDFAALNVKGHPAWYVTLAPGTVDTWVIQYFPGGLYYPALEVKP